MTFFGTLPPALVVFTVDVVFQLLVVATISLGASATYGLRKLSVFKGNSVTTDQESTLQTVAKSLRSPTKWNFMFSLLSVSMVTIAFVPGLFQLGLEVTEGVTGTTAGVTRVIGKGRIFSVLPQFPSNDGLCEGDCEKIVRLDRALAEEVLSGTYPGLTPEEPVFFGPDAVWEGVARGEHVTTTLVGARFDRPFALHTKSSAVCAHVATTSVSYAALYRDPVREDRYGLNMSDIPLTTCENSQPTWYAEETDNPWGIREVGLIPYPTWIEDANVQTAAPMRLNTSSTRISSSLFTTESRILDPMGIELVNGTSQQYTRVRVISDFASSCASQLAEMAGLTLSGKTKCAVFVRAVCALDTVAGGRYGTDRENIPCWAASQTSQGYVFSENFTPDWFGIDEIMTQRSPRRYVTVALALLANGVRNVTVGEQELPIYGQVVSYNSQCLYAVGLLLVTTAVYAGLKFASAPLPLSLPRTVSDGYELRCRETGASEERCGAPYKTSGFRLGISYNDDEEYDHIGVTSESKPYRRELRGAKPHMVTGG
ncbi:predicted protein [Phaeodactylum tricornutum CCAP 1055/1]|jgi:hypothetical protein|uniref:Transmembrane protein n=2 Tax=Phaeodactylum tricornutum TaxID=2850 RepID=B7S4F3_PHATC|nr:predicted protein [Phaeodactylum tricornutum CCAP 1055/1]EEC42570.1 predicted protein [Phaeodactylum tricornutum CCAP 1055/1]|eukprot:XP_002176447.1 predicted protein [Phaeodactylum tricornutum CCAP 1055/1]